MAHDPLAGIRQATFESALVNHERQSLGITEDQLRKAIWGAKDAVGIYNALRTLTDEKRAAMRPRYHDVTPEGGVKPTGAGTGTAGSAGAAAGKEGAS